MAAAMFPDGKSREEFVDEFLTCSICAEPYDSGSHQAKCLPCLHTYCKSCLQKVASKRTELDCPNCRKLVKLPGGTVESLPNNFLIENLREYQNIFNLSVTCGNCDEGNSAVRYCQDCDAFQCQDCTDYHQKMRSTRNHQLVTLEELQAQKRNPMMHRAQYCIKHPKQELTLYCKNSECNVPVCASCSLVDHKNHDLVHLDAAVDEVKASLRRSTAQVNNKYRDTWEKRAEIEALKRAVNSDLNKKKSYIQELEEKLIGSIKMQCSEAQKQLENVCDDEINLLDARFESLNHLASQLTSACEFADQSCDMSNMQLLTLQRQIMNRLNELERIEVPETVLKTNFDFTSEHHSAMAQIQELLPHLSDIRSKAQIDPDQCTIRFGMQSERSDSKGNRKKVFIQAVDSNGDAMVTGGAKIRAMQDGELPYEIDDNSDGTYSFEYSRLSELCVKINNIEMKGSPFDLQPTKPQVDPTKCTVLFGKGKATIQTVDCNGKKIKAGGAAVEVTENDTSCVVNDKNDGTYAFDYENVDGRLVYVKVNREQVAGSPFTLKPIEAEADPQQCTIQFIGLAGACMKGLSKATIQAVDVNGRKMTAGGDKVEVKCGGVPWDVQDNKDGTYEFNYYALQNSLHVMINGVPLKGSPFNLFIDPQKCTIQMEQNCSDITMKKAVIQSRGTNGEKITRGGALVEVTCSESRQSLAVEDNADGTYTFCYVRYLSPPVHIQINGIEMNGSPFLLDYVVSPGKSTVKLGVECGDKTKRMAVIQSINTNRDKLESGGYNVEASQDGELLRVEDNHDGTYAVIYTYDPQSPALLHVKINGNDVHGSPFKWQLNPKKCTLNYYSYTGYYVHTVDVNGMEIQIGGVKVEAHHCKSSLKVEDKCNGRYRISHHKNVDSTNPMFVKICGTEIKYTSYSCYKR